MESSKLSSKFQLTLLKTAREDLGAQYGDRILFDRDEKGRWAILRVPSDPVKALRYLGKRTGLTGTPEEVHREMETWEGWAWTPICSCASCCQRHRRPIRRM